MALLAGGGRLRHRVAQARLALLTPFYLSPFYRLMLRGGVPYTLDVTPPDPWPGDAERGAAILSGIFPLAGESLAGEGELVWDRAGPAGWRAALHGFAWLSDLRAVGGGPARRRARELVAGWCRRFAHFTPEPWRPGLLARRVYAWLGHYDFFIASAEDELRATVLGSLSRQLKHLERVAGAAGEPLDRLAVAKALVAAGVAVREHDARLRRGLARLNRALQRDFFPDGGHRTRSPGAQYRALRELVDIRAALGAAAKPIPERLQECIEKLATVLRFLRHGDGGLALFHDSNEEQGWRIDNVLTQAVSKGSQPQRLPDTGFERMQAGRTVVIVDGGAAPGAGYDRCAHASALAFEMSVGRERLIVNLGAAAPDQGEWRRAQRTTRAHAVLCLGEANSTEPGPAGGFVGPRGRVSARREDADGAVLVDLRQDAYAKRFGLDHRRRLYLAAGGEDLRGEDTLEGAPGHRFTVRFHLHPGVRASVLQAGHAVLLRLPGGQGWRLRAAGGGLALEDSAYLGVFGETRRSQQIAIAGTTGEAGPTVVKWALQREGGRA